MLACLAEIKNDDSLNLRQQMKMRIQQQIRGEYYLPDAAFYYPAPVWGVEVDPSITDIDSALNAADRVMYEDKNSGRKLLLSFTKPCYPDASSVSLQVEP